MGSGAHAQTTAAVDGGSFGTVSRTMRLLTCLAEAEEDLPLAGLAKTVGLPRSTVHRLLGLLRDGGFVAQDPGTHRYRQGVELYRLSAMVVRNERFADRVAPAMERITADCGETALLGVYLPHERRMMFIAEVSTPHALRFHIPKLIPLPMAWGCSGRAIVAHLPEDERRRVLADAGVSPVTGEPPPSIDEFETCLSAIREAGYDHTRSQKIADSVGFAAPLFDPRGVVGSLSITIPVVRFGGHDPEALVTLVRNAARQATLALGGSPTWPSELPSDRDCTA